MAFELGLAPNRLGGPFRLLHEAVVLVARVAKAAPDDDPEAQHRENQLGREADQYADSKLHCSLLRLRP